jgi:uncharacterized membrane protein YphA (DoxX/SURF4 family)
MKFINTAEAHVLYIADEAAVSTYSGPNPTTLSEPFNHAGNIMLMIYVVVIAGLLIMVARKTPAIQKHIHNIFHRALGYADLVPWILRLSLGIALIGAGINGWLVSPVLDGFAMFASAQIVFGFLLLSGFLTTFAALGATLVYLMALSQSFYLFGSLEFFAMSVSLLLLDGRRPGVDHLLGIPAMYLREFKKWIPVMLRVGLGVSFIFLAVYEKFMNPDLAVYVVDIANLQNVINVSPAMWVLSSGIIEFVLGALLIFGFATRVVSALSVVILSLSFFYFGEEVTSHITLFGAMSAAFVLGGKKVNF